MIKTGQDATGAVAQDKSGADFGSDSVADFDDADASADLAAEDYIALIAFGVLIAVVFLQVFTRYVLNNSFGWTEEIARYLLIAMAFLGGGMAVRHRAHVAVRLIDDCLPPAAGRLVDRLVLLLTIAFYGYCGWLAIQIGMALKHQRMTVVDIPISVVYYVVSVGFALMFLRSVQLLVQSFRDVRGHSA